MKIGRIGRSRLYDKLHVNAVYGLWGLSFYAGASICYVFYTRFRVSIFFFSYIQNEILMKNVCNINFQYGRPQPQIEEPKSDKELLQE